MWEKIYNDKNAARCFVVRLKTVEQSGERPFVSR